VQFLNWDKFSSTKSFGGGWGEGGPTKATNMFLRQGGEQPMGVKV